MTLVHATIPIGIFEQSYDPGILLTTARWVQPGRFLGKRVAVHFRDVHAAVFIETGIDRIAHQWLTGYQFKVEVPSLLERIHDVCQRRMRDPRHIGLRDLAGGGILSCPAIRQEIPATAGGKD